MSSGKGRSTILQRPLQRLYPLEIHCCVKGSRNRKEVEDPHEDVRTAMRDETPTVEEQDDADTAPTTGCPSKAAASQARDRIKAWTTYEQEQ